MFPRSVDAKILGAVSLPALACLVATFFMTNGLPEEERIYIAKLEDLGKTGK